MISAMAQVGGPAFTLEMIPAIRQAPSRFPVPTVEELRRGGAFEVTERPAPGPAGAPEVSLLICHWTGAAAAVPCLYFIHGGGMILGNNRSGGTARDMSTPRGSARPWCRSSTASPRRRRTRDRSKTATRA